MSAQKRELIRRLFSESVSQHKIHNTILADLETVLTDEFCYITELLQNANDAGTRHFSMHFQDGYLVYTNDGVPFKEDHVLRICNYSGAHQAQQTPQKKTEDKQTNIKKIGHKGVGFKTVFKFANGVYIRSGGYSFRFDEVYEWQQHSSNPVPWMITPIWTEDGDYPITVRQYLDDTKTQFIFRVQPEFVSKLAAAIRFIQSEMSILLFLDKIQLFSFSGILESEYLRVHIERIVSNNEEIVLLDKTNAKQEKWLVKSYSRVLPADVKAALMQMSEFYCPEKVKNKQDIIITFAVECIEQSKINNNTNKSVLYTHLPTKQKCRLPYLVSADFLLDKSRQNILKNSYNEFLFYAIGYLQFEFAQYIAASMSMDISDQCLNVLGFEFDTSCEKQKASYQAGFSEAATKVRFLKSFKDGSEKITLSDATIDSTKTLYNFPLEHPASNNLIDPKIKFKKRILHYKFGHKIDFHAIVDLIEENLHRATSLPNYYSDLLRHLLSLTIDSKNRNALLNYLKPKKIFSATDKNLYKGEQLFIPSMNTDELDQAIGLPRLNTLVYEAIAKYIIKEELNVLLKGCGLKLPTYENVIRDYLLIRIRDVSTTQEHVSTIKYLYTAHCHRVDFKPYPELQHLKLFTNKSNSKLPANCCLFSTDYQPDADLEKEIQADIFLSPVYLILDESSPDSVKQFFQALGVVSAIEFHEVDITVAEFRQKYPDVAMDYEGFIPNEAVKRLNEENRFLKFSYIDHIQLLGNLSYQRLFFQVFFNRWRSIKEANSNAMLQNSRTKTPIKSFIHYYLNHHANFITCDGQRLPGSKTYHPRFAIFNDDQLPVIDTRVELTAEQVSYLGIICILSLDDMIRLFIRMQREELNDVALEKFRVLYNLVLENDYTEQDILMLRASNIMLPAADQTFQPIGKLKCFDAYEETVPLSKKWLKEVPGMTRDEMKRLSKKINIDIIKQMNVQIPYRELFNEPLVKIKKVLPLFAIYLSKHTFKSPQSNLECWAEKIALLKIYYANEIFDAHDREQKVAVHYDSRLNELTYTDHWDRGDSLRKISIRLTEKILEQSYNYSEELRDLISYTDKDISVWLKRNKVSIDTYQELELYWEEELSRYDQKIVESREELKSTPTLKIKLRLQPSLKREMIAKNPELAQLFSANVDVIPPISVEASFPGVNSAASKRPKLTTDIEEPLHDESNNPENDDLPKINSQFGDIPGGTSNFSKHLILKTKGSNASDEESAAGLDSSSELNKKIKKEKKTKGKKFAEKKRMTAFKPELSLNQLMNLNEKLPNEIEQSMISDLDEPQQPSETKKRKTGNMSGVKALRESQVDQKTRDAIGLHGETICYRRLYEHYFNKYKLRFGEIKYQDHAVGFSLLNQAGDCLVKVDWYDKAHVQDPSVEKNTHDHDILISKPNGKKYIEVKSTVEDEKRSFTLSAGELRAMNKHGERYRFFRVFGVMGDTPKIEVLKNPRKLVEEEKISAEIKSIEISYFRQ